MTGLLLILCFILAAIFLIISFINDYNEEEWRAAMVISIIIGFVFILAIPISRIDSKTNAAYAKVFQETLDYNRASGAEFNVFERQAVIEEINHCNSHINRWKIKGQEWYNNKWYYHPDTQKAEFIK